MQGMSERIDAKGRAGGGIVRPPAKRVLIVDADFRAPMAITVKNTPIDNTLAEFWNVMSIPAPAPR